MKVLFSFEIRNRSAGYCCNYANKGQREAREIAERGQKLATELFDGRLFWQDVKKIAGLA